MQKLPRKPRPRKIEGVTVQPQWQWSRGYAKWFRAMMRGPKLPARQRHENTARLYARWLADRDGISLGTANKAECNWQHGTVTLRTGRRIWKATAIKSVSFFYQAPHQQGRWYAGGAWKGEDIERDLIATVEIPNYAFEPRVTYSEAPELIAA